MKIAHHLSVIVMVIFFLFGGMAVVLITTFLETVVALAIYATVFLAAVSILNAIRIDL